MAHVILPNSTAAMPNTSADRTPMPGAQSALYGLMPGEEIEDEPGEELGKDARVWKTYVRETDTWDKDMVGGRNSSLDVLLIFAALFSAISTAFITASLGDLRPDPADTAVQMQRAMLETQQALLQAVAAVANGQPFSMPSTQPDPVSAPLTVSAIAVNVLWLLSLALSVGVSLIAMLAKDWCYKFMSGRNGPLYEQGYRRQQRWDGIESWKMQELLACLPGAMHLALLLFAIGLCIYLWDIHIAVAVPVTVVTGVVMCGYLAASVLPLAQRYCPYSTPVTPVLQWIMAHPVLQVIKYVRDHSSGSEEILSASPWGRLCAWINAHCAVGSDRTAADSREVQMDDTTARMVAWLIAICHDPRSVDVALQAIAGASSSLPCSALFRCGAHEQLMSRIEVYNDKSGELEDGSASAVSRFIRSYAALYTEDLGVHLSTSEAKVTKLRELLEHHQWGLPYSQDRICDRLRAKKGNEHKAVLLVAAANSMMISRTVHLGLTSIYSQGIYQSYTTQLVIPALQSYSLGKTVLDSVTVRHVLRSLSDRVAACEWTGRYVSGSLCGALALLCIVSDGTAPDISHMASAMLAAAAFALCSYPGGEQPGVDDQSARSKRALRVLEYYQSHEPDDNVAAGLYAFGFVAVLPHLERGVFNDCGCKDKVLRHLFRGLFWLVNGVTVHSLPDGCTLDDHLGSQAVVLQERTASDEPAHLRAWSDILRNQCGLDLSDPHLCASVLWTLARTDSVQLQELCESVLDSQVLSKAVQEQPGPFWWIYWRMRDLQARRTNAAVSPAFIAYARLVAAHMLCPTTSLSQRQEWASQWKGYWADNDVLRDLKSDGDMPSSDAILHHLAEDTDQMDPLLCMRATAQLFINFCSSDDLNATPQPVYAEWQARLHEIRCSRRPAARAVNWDGTPAVDGAASDKPSGAGAAHDDGTNADPLAEPAERQSAGMVEEMLLSGDGTAWD